MISQDKKTKRTQNKIKKLQSQISELEASIAKERKVCKHPDDQMTAEYGANTGGFDGPEFDIYWVNGECNACGETWRADSKEDAENYRWLSKFTRLG